MLYKQIILFVIVSFCVNIKPGIGKNTVLADPKNNLENFHIDVFPDVVILVSGINDLKNEL